MYTMIDDYKSVIYGVGLGTLARTSSKRPHKNYISCLKCHVFSRVLGSNLLAAGSSDLGQGAI